jgi:RHS repeat-associated protein
MKPIGARSSALLSILASLATSTACSRGSEEVKAIRQALQGTIPPEGGVVSGTTSGSSQFGLTIETCGQSHAAGPEHVYAWTPTVSGQTVITTCSSNTTFDTVLYIKEANTTSEPLACDDDTCAISTGDHWASRIAPTVQAGTTYYIFVDGWGETDMGDYVLTVNSPVARRTVPPGGGVFSGTTSGVSLGTASCAGETAQSPEHVYVWTPSSSGQAMISTCGANTHFDTVVSVGTSADGSSELNCNNDAWDCEAGGSPTSGSRVPVQVTAGTTYYISVDGANAEGDYSLTVEAAPGPVIHGTIPPAGGTVSGSTGGLSTTSASHPSCSDVTESDQAGEHIYAWTPSTSGQAIIHTCNGNTRFDSVLYVSNASDGSAQLFCSDDEPGCEIWNGNPTGSRISMNVTAGTTYYIYVDGTNQYQFGNYTLTVEPAACTTNAQCDDGQSCNTDTCSAGVCEHSALDFSCVNALRFPVHLDPNGHGGGSLCINGAGCATSGHTDFSLAPGVYTVVSTNAIGNDGSSNVGTFTVQTNGVLELDQALAASFQPSGSRDETLTAKVRKLTLDFNGFKGVMYVNGAAFLTASSGPNGHENELSLLVGRRYQIGIIYSANLEGQEGVIHSDTFGYGFEITPTGGVTGDSAVAASFEFLSTAQGEPLLKARTQTVTLDQAGYIGAVGVNGIGMFEGADDHKSITLVRNRRYSVAASYTADLAGNPTALGAYGLGVSANDGSVVLYGGADTYFDPPLKLRTAAITFEMGQYLGSVDVTGAFGFYGGGTHTYSLIKGLSYSLGTPYAFHPTSFSYLVGSRDSALRVAVDGTVSVFGGEESFRWSGRTLIARIVPIAIHRNGALEEFCLGRIECSQPTDSDEHVVHMLAGRRYEVPGLYASPPVNTLMAVPATGNCSPDVIDMDMGLHHVWFECKGETDNTLDISSVGYDGQICIDNVGCLAGGHLFASVLPGTYSMRAPGTRNNEGNDYLGTFILYADGTVTPDINLGRSFSAAGSRQLQAKLSPVTVDFQGYTGSFELTDVGSISAASPSITLLNGRSYALAAPATTGLSGAPSTALSTTATAISLDTNGALSVYGGAENQFTSSGAGGRALLAKVTDVPFNLAGFPGWVGIAGVGQVHGNESIKLLNGRQYALLSPHAIGVNDESDNYSPSGYGMSVGNGGTLALDAGLQDHFYVDGGAVKARVTAVYVEPQGYGGQLIAGGIGSFTGGPPPALTLIAGRRYQMLGGIRFTVPTSGACSPTSMFVNGHSIGISCGVSECPADAPPHTSCPGADLCDRRECVAGACVSVSPDPNHLPDPCSDETCDPVTGQIVLTPKSDQEGQHCGGEGCGSKVCHTGTCAPDPAIAESCKLVPVVSCIINEGGKHTAIFGYTSTSTVAVHLPAVGLGAPNSFSPAPALRGQPEWFSTGTHENAVAVEFDGSGVTWSLGNGADSASLSTTRTCTDDEAKTAKKHIFFDPAGAMASSIEPATSLYSDSSTAGTLGGGLDVDSSGHATYRIPLAMPAGRRGIQPSLSLGYTSGSRANGPLGVGWGLAGLSSIQRCRKTIDQDGAAGPIRMSAEDALCLDGKRLVRTDIHLEGGGSLLDPPSTASRTYQTQVDSYSRVQSGPFESSGPRYFEVSTRDGRILTYGYKTGAPTAPGSAGLEGNRYAAAASFNPDVDGSSSTDDLPSYSSVILDWPLTQIRDRFGNSMTIEYESAPATAANGMAFERWPSQIRYTDHPSQVGRRTVKFVWAPDRTPTSSLRKDGGITSFVGGVKVVNSRLLQSVEAWAPNPAVTGKVRSYQLEYDTSPSTQRARLISVKECDGAATPVCAQPTTFTYTSTASGAEFDDAVETPITSNMLGGPSDGILKFNSRSGLQVADINGDGLDDLALVVPNDYNDQLTDGTVTYFLSDGRQFGEGTVLHGTRPHPSTNPNIFSASLPSFADFDGDGRPEVMVVEKAHPGDNVVYKRSGRATRATNDGIFPAAQFFPFGELLSAYETIGSGDDYLNGTYALIPVDLDGDGLPELLNIQTDNISTSFYAFRKNQAGVLQPPTTFAALSGHSFTGAPWLLDVDGDGRTEVLAGIVGKSRRYSISLAANGQTATPIATTISSNGSDTELGAWPADVNGDGLKDIVRVRQSPGVSPAPPTLVVQINTGNGFLPGQTLRTFAPGDVLFPAGCNPSTGTSSTTANFCVNSTNHDDGVRVVDLDGDGVDELLMVDNGEGSIGRDGMGTPYKRAFASVLKFATTPSDVDAVGHTLSSLKIGVDANGPDGVVWVSSCNRFVTGCALVRGKKQCLPIRRDTGEPFCLGYGYGFPGAPYGYQFSQTLDANGDGLPDVVDLDPVTQKVMLHIRRGPVSDMLSAVTTGKAENGYGGTVEVSYLSITDKSRAAPPSAPAENVLAADEQSHPLYDQGTCSAQQSCLKGGTWVVSEVVRDNGMTHSSWLRTRYSYKDGRVDRFGHGFLGFTDVWEQSWRTEGVDSIVTTKHSAYPIRPPTPGHQFDGPYQAGRPSQIDSYVTRLNVQGIGVSHRAKERLENYVYDRGSVPNRYVDVVLAGADSTVSEVKFPAGTSTQLSHIVSAVEFPDGNLSAFTLGRPRSITVDTLDVDGSPLRHDVRTVLQYHPDDIGAWLIGPPKDVQVESTAIGDPSPAARPRVNRYDYDMTNLFLRSISVEPDQGTSDEKVTTTFQPVSTNTGQIASVTAQAGDGTARSVQYGYDALEEMYRQTVTNALGQKATVIVHPGLDLPAFHQDLNGVVVGMIYDSLGRLRRVDNPEGLGDVTTAFETNPNRVKTTSPGGALSYSYFDRLERAYKRESQLPGAAFSAVNVGFDSLGRVTSVSSPYPAAGSPTSYSTATYDELGRTLQLLQPVADGGTLATVRYQYDGALTTVSTPPASSQRSEADEKDIITDGRGLIVRSTEWLVENGHRTAVSTDFTYGAFDLLKSAMVTSDGHGPQITTMTYDQRGRRKTLTRPDVQTVTASFNGLGELTRLDEPDNSVAIFHRDALGRVSQKTVDKNGLRAEDSTWNWGAANAFGAIESTVTLDQTKTAFEYDGLGRPTSVRRRVVGVGDELVVEQSYDAVLGRPDVTSYPPTPGWPRLQVKRQYDGPTGALKSVERLDTSDPSKKVVWQAQAYDSWGHLTQETLGGATISRGFNQETGQLLSIDSHQTNSGARIAELSYHYYADGTVKTVASRTGQGDQMFEEFEHDSLGRLNTWQAASSMGAPSPETWKVDYVYDARGDLKSRIASAGSVTQTATFGYGGTNAGPHAVSSWDISGGGQPTSTGALTYDGGGRAVTHSRLGTINYNSFDLPTTIDGPSGAATFKYDANGNRVYKHDSQGSTLYLGPYELRWSADGTSREHVLYVIANGTIGQIVRSESTGSEKTLFYHRDRLGSVTAVADENGFVESRRTDPFGARMAANSQPFLQTSVIAPDAAGVRKGITGHEADEALGLVNMGGRVYDPMLGRFLTADPVNSAPLSAQSHNPYSYVFNSPIRFVDPSGYAAEKPEAPEEEENTEESEDDSDPLMISAEGLPPEEPQKPDGSDEVVPPGFRSKADAYEIEGIETSDPVTDTYNEVMGDATPPPPVSRVGSSESDEAWYVTAASYVPVLGNAIGAVQDFRSGHIVGGIFHTVVAIVEVVTLPTAAIKSLGVAAGKAAIGAIVRAAEEEVAELAVKEGAELLAKEGAEVIAEQAAEETITLYHGSVDNFSKIATEGLEASRAPTWVTTDVAAAENAIGPGRVLSPGQGLDTGIVTSKVSRSAFEALQPKGISPPRSWPGFGGGQSLTEHVLRSPEAIELFNSGIVR